MHASSYLVAAVGFAAYAYAQGANGFTVATPNSLVQCQPVRLTWTGGVPPYFPRISQPGQVGQIIDQFPQTTETFFVWTVNQPVGQTVTIAVGDSSGDLVGSAITPPIVAGSTSCLNGNGGNGGSASNSGSASSSGSTSSSAGPSSTATRPTSSSTGGSSTGTRPTNTTNSAPATSTTPAGTRPDSASSIRGYSAIVAGAVGVVAAALA